MIRDKVRHPDRADEKSPQRVTEKSRQRWRQTEWEKDKEEWDWKLMGRFEGNGLWIPFGPLLVPL